MTQDDESVIFADFRMTQEALDDLARLLWPMGQTPPGRSLADIRERTLERLRWNNAIHGLPSTFIGPDAPPPLVG